MADPTLLFDDPEVLCLSVPELRRYWGYLLQDCLEKHAQEHPLYALFSSVLSTLSKAITTPSSRVSPASADGSILFSYPQCRVVDKRAVGESEYASMSAYPDFGLMHLATKRLANDQIKVEQAKLLIEIKRLYRSDESGGCLWADTINLPFALDHLVSLNLRQMLLQAYCAFNVYNQREVFVMLVPGVYFTLLKFKRPEDFEPLARASGASNKKRKLGAEEFATTGKPKCWAAKEISNSQLAKLIPLEYVEVMYHSAPVFEDIQARDVRLSDAFRQALRERLDDTTLQPCSLFDLHSAQYAPMDKDVKAANRSISHWYSTAKAQGDPKTPDRRLQPYVESPIDGKEMLLSSPGFQGAVPGVGSRGSLQRSSKDFINSIRFANQREGNEDSGQGGLDAAGDVGGSHQEGTESTDDEGEGLRGLLEGE